MRQRNWKKFIEYIYYITYINRKYIRKCLERNHFLSLLIFIFKAKQSQLFFSNFLLKKNDKVWINTKIPSTMNDLSCILYPVSCILYHVSCILYHVSCFLYSVSCIMYHVSFILYPVSLSCIMYPVSFIPYPVSCIL